MTKLKEDVIITILTGGITMEGFTLGLALLDYVPVAAFGIGVLLIGKGFGSPLFILGASLSFVAGIMKATWKLILGISKKDIRWLNKPFVPIQASGFMIMLLAVLLNIKKLDFSVLFAKVSALPQLFFFILYVVLMILMVWYRKKRFKKYDSRTNLTAEIINSCCQLSFMAGVLLSL